jgi:hypothetical protein
VMADGIRSQSYVSIDGERDGGARASCRNPGGGLVVDVIALRENGTFFEFSLCLSRACLGKITHFIYKWRKKCRFPHPGRP